MAYNRKRSQLGSADVDISHYSNPRPDLDSMDLDSNSGGTADKKHGAHPKKRPRTMAPNSKQSLAKETIEFLPPEILTEVFKYLRPGDLLSLARCNKKFKAILTSKSSQLVWLRAMTKVRELPPCPRGFFLPYYLAVLFSPHCTNCDGDEESKLDVTLLVRLCKTCEDKCLLELVDPRVPDTIREFLHRSNVFGDRQRDELPYARVLKSDVDDVTKALAETERSGNDHALTELKKQMEDEALVRREQAKNTTHALELFENDLQWERKENQRKRRLEIERRCIEDLNVQREDLLFAWDSPTRKEYYKLLKKPSLLYNDEWMEICPELKRLLLKNHKARLAKDKGDHQQRRVNYPGEARCPLILHVDPVMDGLYHTEGVELLI
ncbi:hypothetical protein OPQ81_000196 [Rhizoctonia solani]|nr:hypothetical protein OPQ81_000196 [Rhizoctonia solani]